MKHPRPKTIVTTAQAGKAVRLLLALEKEGQGALGAHRNLPKQTLQILHQTLQNPAHVPSVLISPRTFEVKQTL